MKMQGGKKRELRVRDILVLRIRKEKTHSNTDNNHKCDKDSSPSSLTSPL